MRPFASYLYSMHHKRDALVSALFNHGVYYPTPVNLSYLWNFGSLAGVCLVLQILTGIFLGMHYVPHIDLAFNSVEHVMRDVNFGWLIRYLHSNGASFFFATIYLHIARGLYYGSYRFDMLKVWISGLVIFLLRMATAFIGYVLPWRSMSLWRCTVVTSLFSAIPYIGDPFVKFLWGVFSVRGPTLNRFYSLHFALPFILARVVLIHLSELHEAGSSNPFPLEHHQWRAQKITFYPYFVVKDYLGFLVLLSVLLAFVFYAPNALGHTDNYIPANPLVTPRHIVPEWYFLRFYAILRSIPDKLGGVIAMFGAILVFFLLPFLNYLTERLNFDSKNFTDNMFTKLRTWSLFRIFVGLVWLGRQPVEEPFITTGLLFTIAYFSVIFLLGVIV